MASSYALPIPPPPTGNHHLIHSRSYSNVDPPSNRQTSNSFPNNNASAFVKKSVSNGNLYTHAEVSRETSPLPSPYTDHDQPPDPNSPAARVISRQIEQRLHQHTHSLDHPPIHSRSPSSFNLQMKALPSRPRGESDLGRPAPSNHPHAQNSIVASTPWLPLPEALTSLLIPLPYILASLASSSGGGGVFENELSPPSAYTKLQKSVLDDPSGIGHEEIAGNGSGLVQAGILTSGTLLLVGIIAKSRFSDRTPDRPKERLKSAGLLEELLTKPAARDIVFRALGIGLPFYAAAHIGGIRTGLILLVAFASGASNRIVPVGLDWRDILRTRSASLAVFLLSLFLDVVGLTFNAPLADLFLGYLALACALFLVQLPVPYLPPSSASTATPATMSDHGRTSWAPSTLVSPLTNSDRDATVTLVTGLIMSILTFLASAVTLTSPLFSGAAIVLSIVSIASAAAVFLFSQPYTLQSRSKAGLGLGCLLSACCAFLFSPSLWPGTICNGGLAALSLFGVVYDAASTGTHNDHHDIIHDHTHNAHTHTHTHHHHNDDGRHSFLTKFLLERCKPGSLIYGILNEKDSRRIAYFTLLNFGFMIVQGIYGYLSGSLGLLSDTVHMFFDCLGLVVGLGAAVASKWPTSPERPYGWGKLNTLAGFGNGIFLMLVSVEFVWEAVEGIVEQKELRHVRELLVVSTLGFLVNMVGLLAFGHAHAGHDHGHGHDHSHHHGHSHDHHAQNHSHNSSRTHGSNSSHSHESKEHTHSHDPSNENMHGIFLHVAADAGGSLAVILSTALTLWQPWYLWDPLATIVIAVLIFAAAVPLVTSSGQKLLLVIPDDLEYNIKHTLHELGELRGVVGYAVPRFWVDDRDDTGGAHGHDHHHHHAGHGSGAGRKQRVLGVIHIIAAPAADLEDVRVRVDEFMRERNMDIVIHVEREAEGQCWCGGGGGVGHKAG